MATTPSWLGYLLLWLFLASSILAIVEHHFHVQNLTLNRLCRQQVITAVNGKFPGPPITVHEGDTVIVHVFNKSPYKHHHSLTWCIWFKPMGRLLICDRTALGGAPRCVIVALRADSVFDVVVDQ